MAKVLTVCQSRNANSLEEAENAEEKEERSYGVIMMERLTGSAKGWIDHILQKKKQQVYTFCMEGNHLQCCYPVNYFSGAFRVLLSSECHSARIIDESCI
ncbi:phospholipase SGR2-like isoform X2 [Mangifera indica]|uniref:phospholipase SGR2-like isoform X2 n=1 Tax=Mangifera indica TaxID=29780 RepID=UPI001CFA3FCB|nr:phospholipase SGR2-like isoform X2 [Mangifera indica]